jgi:hypothetical protein
VPSRARIRQAALWLLVLGVLVQKVKTTSFADVSIHDPSLVVSLEDVDIFDYSRVDLVRTFRFSVRHPRAEVVGIEIKNSLLSPRPTFKNAMWLCFSNKALHGPVVFGRRIFRMPTVRDFVSNDVSCAISKIKHIYKDPTGSGWNLLSENNINACTSGALRSRDLEKDSNQSTQSDQPDNGGREFVDYIKPPLTIMLAALSLGCGLLISRKGFRFIDYGWKAGLLFSLCFLGWLICGMVTLVLIASALAGN